MIALDSSIVTLWPRPLLLFCLSFIGTCLSQSTITSVFRANPRNWSSSVEGTFLRLRRRALSHSQSRHAADALWQHVSGASTRIGRKYRYGAGWLWLAPSDAKLVMGRSRWLQFTVEQIPHLRPTHRIVTPVSDTSEFAVDRFGNHKTHQFDAYRTGRRVRASGHGDARV